MYSDTADVAARVGAMGVVLSVLARLYRPRPSYGKQRHRVLCNSPYGARRIKEAYGRPATVIEHGVDFPFPSPQEVESLRERYALLNSRVVVTVNHLHPRKRIDLFLKSVRLAQKEVPETVALVVGGGPEEAALKDLQTAWGCNWVAMPYLPERSPKKSCPRISPSEMFTFTPAARRALACPSLRPYTRACPSFR